MMKNKVIRIIICLIIAMEIHPLCLLAGTDSVDNTDLFRACSVKTVQTDCQKTCAEICVINATFMEKYWDYCISVLPPQEPNDSDECNVIIENTLQGLPPLPPPSPSDPCAEIKPLFDQIDCMIEVQKRANKYPQCANNVIGLIDNANILSGKIERTLAGYSEILSLNLEKVQDLKALCDFSREDLSRFYSQASEKGQDFDLLQNEAEAIEACSGDFEQWLRDVSNKEIHDKGSGRIQDILDHNLITETTEQLEMLKPQRAKLYRSVETLKTLVPKLRAIAIRHVSFCRSPQEQLLINHN